MPYKNKEIGMVKNREWVRLDREKNPEKYRAYAKKKYYANQEKRLAYAKKYRNEHKDLVKESTKKWRKENRKNVLEMKKRWYKKNAPSILYRAKSSTAEARRKVILHYGGKCSCCGEHHYEFLTIEHKNGGGTKHRKEIGAANIARFIIKNSYPNEYDVLCYNCNCAKAFSKICPHKITGQMGKLVISEQVTMEP